jgi:amino acid adenylation domain-containing protein
MKLPPEQEAIRAKCFHPSGTFVEFPKEDVETSIPERFEKMVRAHSDRLAIQSKTHSLTYETLNELANQLARAILARRPQENEPIALLLEQGAFSLAAILAVLKAGKIYVALDPSHPQARIRHILDDTEAPLIVTDSKNVGLAGELARDGCQCVNIDQINSNLSTQNVGLHVLPKTPAYIMYTSGSTGQPKGVVQNHRNLLQSCKNYTNGFHVSVDDRLSLLHSCSFNASVYNLFGALLNGAALLPFNLKQEGVHELGKWLAQKEITICHTSPTAFSHAAQAFTGEESFPNLRVMHLSSAPVTKSDVELCKKHFAKNCIFVHRMGVTETGTIRWYFMDRATPINEPRVPIGYPADRKEVLLLDESGREVGRDNIGEIAVRSCYLALGYWQKPQLSHARFLPDPSGGNKKLYLTGDLGRVAPDGCVFHLGRKDFQVKVRGYRVELGEIELALRENTAVKETAVVGREMQSGDRQLVAYIVSNTQPATTVTDLRNFLRARFPDYMIPSAFVMLTSLPLTPNGKVDHSALPDPGHNRPELDTPLVSPSNPIEEELARIWAEVLSLEKVGINDIFFDLGGDSLTATRVVSRVIEQFQLAIPLQSLFESATIADMAAVITEHRVKTLDENELMTILDELEALSDEEVQCRMNKSNSTIAKN